MKVQEWFTTNELLGLPGMPGTKQGITKMAGRENWQRNKPSGVKGRAYVYHIDSLPVETQTYFRSEVLQAKEIEPLNNYSKDCDTLLDRLGVDGVAFLAELVRRKGADAVLLSEQTRQIALMLEILSSDDRKEISLLINQAQYCALKGIPFSLKNYIKENTLASGGGI